MKSLFKESQEAIWTFTSVSLFLVLLSSVVFAQVSGAISFDPNIVFAGESVVVTIEIENAGIENILDINVSIENENLSFSRYIEIDRLEVLGKYSRSYDLLILPDTESDLYFITATLSYNNIQTTLSSEALDIREFPIEMEYSLQNIVMDPGSANNLTVSVKNTGDTLLTDAAIEVDFPTDFSADMETLPIGDLTVYQEVSKIFSFYAPNQAQGEYHIHIKAVFYDDMGRHVFSKYMKISVGTGMLSNTVELVVIITVLILLIGFAAKRFF